MVRTRVRQHLDALKDRFPDLLGACDIHSSAEADYAFRVFLPKDTWVRVVERLVDDIDYDNFKSEVSRHQGASGAAYKHSLAAVWSVMYELQKQSTQ